MADPANGRFANVAAAVLPGGVAQAGERSDAGAAARLAALLAALFEEVLCVGHEPPAFAGGCRAEDIEGPAGALRDIGSALAAATAERVLLVPADAEDVTLEHLLALVAWPEAEAVVPRAVGAGSSSCALVCREPALRALRAEFAAGRNDVCRWLEALATAYVDPEALPGV